MGNAILKSFSGECYDDSPPPQRPQNSWTCQEYGAPGLKGFNSLKSDLVTFQTTSQVLIFRDIKGFDSVKSDIKGFDSPKSDIKGFDSVKSDIKGFDSPKSDIKGFDSPKSDIKGFKSPKSDIKGFKSPKSDIKGFKSPKSDIKGFNSLKSDLGTFQTTSQVPEGLGDHLPHSKKTQAEWYRKILSEWRGSDPRPRTPQDASNLIARAFTKDSTLAHFLKFYNLPSAQITTNTSVPSKWPQGVQFEINTLPVNAKLIGDGDGMTVHVDAADPRESSNVPTEIQEAAIKRRNCQAVRNYKKADKLEQNIIKQGYRVIKGPNNEETLAKDYKIRLKGIDAPEMDMKYGKKAQDELIKLIQNKHLKIQIYGQDRYSRWLGDVYCNGVFIQKILLKRGCAWHHVIYDDRPEFAKWEKAAKNAGRGLWANPHAVAPWVHKGGNNNGRNSQRKCKSQKSMKKEQGVLIQVW